ncbi:PREDICTED: uncharacterized protein LOC101304373 [Fragaria vesca subsp. vesca]
MGFGGCVEKWVLGVLGKVEFEKAAIEASHKVKLRSLEKADSVLALFRRYEFSDTQISDLVRRHPRLLLVANAQKTLLPKLEFLSSIGMSRLDLVKTVSLSNMLLHRSLKNNSIPCYTYLKKLVISDAKVVFIIKHHSWFFWQMPAVDVTANIRLGTDLGMPSNCIAYLLKSHTRIVTKKHEEFSQIVSNVKGMGFGPRKILFVQAMGALSVKQTAWRVKEQVYKRWGWSESDIRSAFRMLPLCMLVSEEKIMGVMEFLVNTMGWKSGEVAEYPYVLSYSLEKRIIPRCSVIRVLLLKGLIEEMALTLASVSTCPEEYFLSRFVTRYLDRVPQLLNVYHQKVDVEDV